ncbi:hypothetical protein CHS0354_034125 [Potamilus streckersoni]|uniref:SKA complex subunit 1 n=1 Tax=Potamilus streckersoni TaxID=2493646 RepID=A0AAE0TD21_9BIVA|nr:hypothetical protein CHS0354_034125 [Potamilus streckersoni]
MDSGSLEELAQHFKNKLSDLQTVLEIQNTKDDDICQTSILSLETELENLEVVMVLLQNELKKAKEECEKKQKLNEELLDFNKCLQYTISNVPERLPRQQSNTEQRKKESKVIEENGKPCDSEVKEDLPPVGNSNNSNSQQSKEPLKKSFQEQNINNVYQPEIQYLTVEEFEAVPKYMKGRMNYKQVNAMIDEMNKAYGAKYKLLKQKKSSLNDVNRKRYELYKLQESKDTAGCYFIVDDDIKEFSVKKMDNTSRSILTILRHCGRIKEVRGGRLVRYVLVDMY